MTCLSRYAEAIDYASMFCSSGGYLSSLDTSAHVLGLSLEDTGVDFVRFGVKANEGMLLYNVTRNTHGPITAVTTNTITATGVLWSGGDTYRLATLDTAERSSIDAYLSLTAADINAALSSVGACSCTLSAWGLELAKKINIIEASAFHVCPCAKPMLTPERQQAFIDWANNQFEQIRQSKIDLCGQTGSEYPAVGDAQYGHTIWTEEQMIINARLKGLP